MFFLRFISVPLGKFRDRSRLKHDHFLPDTFQFITHLPIRRAGSVAKKHSRNKDVAVVVLVTTTPTATATLWQCNL
jgi:hypothetical protein